MSHEIAPLPFAWLLAFCEQIVFGIFCNSAKMIVRKNQADNEIFSLLTLNSYTCCHKSGPLQHIVKLDGESPLEIWRDFMHAREESCLAENDN